MARTEFARNPNLSSRGFHPVCFVSRVYTSQMVSLRGIDTNLILTLVSWKPPKQTTCQRAPNEPEFAQPRLSRVKWLSSPARGYKFGCACSYVAGHCLGILMTGHLGTNAPKFVPPRWGRPPFDPRELTEQGLFAMPSPLSPWRRQEIELS